jgi:hypothetical protein
MKNIEKVRAAVKIGHNPLRAVTGGQSAAVIIRAAHICYPPAQKKERSVQQCTLARCYITEELRYAFIDNKPDNS